MKRLFGFIVMIIIMLGCILPGVAHAGDTIWNVPLNVLGEINADTVDTERLRGMADHIVESGTEIKDTINNQIQDGDIVAVGPTTLTIDTPLQITNDRVTIVGAGREATTIKLKDGSGTRAFEIGFEGNAQDIELLSMKIDGDSEPNNPMVAVGADDVIIRGVKMVNCGRSCVGVGLVGSGGTTHTPIDLRVELSEFDNATFAGIEVIDNATGTDLDWAFITNRFFDPFKHAIYAPDSGNHSGVAFNELIIEGPGRNASGTSNGIRWDKDPGGGGMALASSIFEDLNGIGVRIGAAEVALNRFNGIGDTAIQAHTTIVANNLVVGTDTGVDVFGASPLVIGNRIVTNHRGLTAISGGNSDLSIQSNYFLVTGKEPAILVDNDSTTLKANDIHYSGSDTAVVERASVNDAKYYHNSVTVTSSGGSAFDLAGTRQSFRGNEPQFGASEDILTKAVEADQVEVQQDADADSEVPRFDQLGAAVVDTASITSDKTDADTVTTVTLGPMGDTYPHYEILISGVSPTVNEQNLQMRVSTDGGATFLSGSDTYSWVLRRFIGSGNQTNNQSEDSQIRLTQPTGESDTKAITGRIQLPNPSDSNQHPIFDYDMSNDRSAGMGLMRMVGTGRFNKPDAYTHVQFQFSGATDIDAGQFTLRGVR